MLAIVIQLSGQKRGYFRVCNNRVSSSLGSRGLVLRKLGRNNCGVRAVYRVRGKSGIADLLNEFLLDAGNASAECGQRRPNVAVLASELLDLHMKFLNRLRRCQIVNTILESRACAS